MIDLSITWLRFAIELSKRSKDPSTKVGCVLASPDDRSISIGYNGFIAGIEEEWWHTPEKYDHVIHAEMNALMNAGRSVQGWRCFCTHRPCIRCAVHLRQAGITQVAYIYEHKSVPIPLHAYCVPVGAIFPEEKC